MDGYPEFIEGKYRLVRKIGQGGLGTVFEARDTQLDLRVAVKLIPTSDADPSVLQRARHEYRALSMIDSPNIVRVLGFGDIEGATYIVQEFVDGILLSELVPLALGDALTVADALAGALAKAHARGFIHRDIKPGNVKVPGERTQLAFGSAKLLDFGVAGLLDHQNRGQRATMAGQFYGTPVYMSPEQIRGDPQDTRTDVYGLGILLYEMLFGRPPFDGKRGTPVLLAVLGEAPPFPSEPALPNPVRSFLERCLAKEPDRRPADGQVVQGELAQMLAQASAGMAGQGRLGVSPAPLRSTGQVAVARSPLAGEASGRIALVNDTLHPNFNAYLDAPLLAGYGAGFSSALARVWPWILAALSLIGATLVVAVVPWTPWLAFGLLGLALSWGLAWLVHRFIEKRRPPLGSAVAMLLGRATAREDLTQSLALDVGKLVEACRQIDEQILAKTLALMIGEYDTADASADRQGALMKAVELLEKLQKKLAPWYVKYQALLSWGIGIVGSALSVLKAAIEMWGGVRR